MLPGWEPQNYKLLKRTVQTISLFVFFLMAGFSFTEIQAQKKVWLDTDHKEVTEKDGIYYRAAPQKRRSGYFIIDYYKDGNKYREGKAEFTTVGREKFNGVLTYYFNNGTIAKKERYRKGVLNGLYKEYYPSGELKIDGAYDKGYEEGVWKYYHKTGKIRTRGRFKNGEKVGIWKTFYKNVYYPDDE